MRWCRIRFAYRNQTNMYILTSKHCLEFWISHKFCVLLSYFFLAMYQVVQTWSFLSFIAVWSLLGSLKSIRFIFLDANLVCDDVGLGWHTDGKQCNFSILDANLVCDDVELGWHTDIKQTCMYWLPSLV